jgi:hypothetical protein
MGLVFVKYKGRRQFVIYKWHPAGGLITSFITSSTTYIDEVLLKHHIYEEAPGKYLSFRPH